MSAILDFLNSRAVNATIVDDAAPAKTRKAKPAATPRCETPSSSPISDVTINRSSTMRCASHSKRRARVDVGASTADAVRGRGDLFTNRTTREDANTIGALSFDIREPTASSMLAGWATLAPETISLQGESAEAATAAQPRSSAPRRKKSARQFEIETRANPARGESVDQVSVDSQNSGVDALSHLDGQAFSETQLEGAVPVDAGGHDSLAYLGANASRIDNIVYLWRMRQRWHRAEKALILQGKALCRSLAKGDKAEGSKMFDDALTGKPASDDIAFALAPFFSSIEQFSAPRAAYEKKLAKLVRDLPAYEFVKNTYGVGDLGFAGIVGECGDIGSYKSVSAVWKRLGLAVISGERQRKKAGDEALLHGYNPSRRSVMWNVGNGLIGGMGHGKRPAPGEDVSLREEWTTYQKLFVERCRYECERDPENFPMNVVEKDGEPRESYTKHTQARAKRYVEKRFIRHLFAAWRADVGAN